MLKKLFPILALAAFSTSAHAGAVKAEPVSEKEAVELKADAATPESEKAEDEEGGLLGIPGGFYGLVALAAAVYVATK